MFLNNWGAVWNLFRALILQLLLLSPATWYYDWSWEQETHSNNRIIEVTPEKYVDLQRIYADDLIWVVHDNEVVEFERMVAEITEEDMKGIEQDAQQFATEMYPQMVQAGINISFKTLLYLAGLILLFYFLWKWTEKIQDWSNKQMRNLLLFTFMVAGLWFAFVVYPELQHKVPYGREISWWVKEIWGQAWWLIKEYWGAIAEDVYGDEKYSYIRILLALLLWSILTWLLASKAKLPKKALAFCVFSVVWYFANHLYDAITSTYVETTQIVAGTGDSNSKQQQFNEKTDQYKKNIMHQKHEISNQDELIIQLMNQIRNLNLKESDEVDWSTRVWHVDYIQNIPEIDGVPAQKMHMKLEFEIREMNGTQFFSLRVRSDAKTWILRIGNRVIVWNTWYANWANLFSIAAFVPSEEDIKENGAYPKLGYNVIDTDNQVPLRDQPNEKNVVWFLQSILPLLPK